eukprot:g69080.t1
MSDDDYEDSGEDEQETEEQKSRREARESRLARRATLPSYQVDNLLENESDDEQEKPDVPANKSDAKAIREHQKKMKELIKQRELKENLFITKYIDEFRPFIPVRVRRKFEKILDTEKDSEDEEDDEEWAAEEDGREGDEAIDGQTDKEEDIAGVDRDSTLQEAKIKLEEGKQDLEDEAPSEPPSEQKDDSEAKLDKGSQKDDSEAKANKDSQKDDSEAKPDKESQQDDYEAKLDKEAQKDDSEANMGKESQKDDSEAKLDKASQKDNSEAKLDQEAELKRLKEEREAVQTRESADLINVRKKMESDLNVIVSTHPSYVRNGIMRDYQLTGLTWMISRHDLGVGGILGDEMGLGKTVQSISFLAYLKEVRQFGGPHLVVVPLSVLNSWMDEFRRWAPQLKTIRFHGPASERRRLTSEEGRFGRFDVCVTTYEMLASKEEVYFKQWIWSYLVVDEAHRVKNEDTQQSKALSDIKVYNRIFLTGTPVQNNLHEMWSLLNALFPKVFTSSKPFDKCFNLTKSQIDDDMLSRAHVLMQPLMLRRIKTEVETKLPPKTETKIYVPLSACQTFWYKRLLMKDLGNVNLDAGNNEEEGTIEGEGGESGDWRKLMSLFMQLRKVCNHPYLFEQAVPDYPTEENLAKKEAEEHRSSALEKSKADRLERAEDEWYEEMIRSSGKLKILDKLLVKMKKEGHRVLIFSLFTKMLNILEDYCKFRGWNYARLDGSTNRVRRSVDIRRFNAPNSKLFVYLISTRAGGLGINLYTADAVIHYDSDFNPQVDLQAQDRAHRIGQTKPVHVYRFVTQDTVEQRLIRRADKKLYLDMMINRQGKKLQQGDLDSMERLSRGEVVSMLLFGADRIIRATGEEVEDEDIEVILQRSKQTHQDEQNNMSAKSQLDVQNETNYTMQSFNFAVKEQAIREFRGEMYEKATGPSKRKSQIRLIDDVDGADREGTISDIGRQWKAHRQQKQKTENVVGEKRRRKSDEMERSKHEKEADEMEQDDDEDNQEEEVLTIAQRKPKRIRSGFLSMKDRKEAEKAAEEAEKEERRLEQEAKRKQAEESKYRIEYRTHYKVSQKNSPIIATKYQRALRKYRRKEAKKAAKKAAKQEKEDEEARTLWAAAAANMMDGADDNATSDKAKVKDDQGHDLNQPLASAATPASTTPSKRRCPYGPECKLIAIQPSHADDYDHSSQVEPKRQKSPGDSPDEKNQEEADEDDDHDDEREDLPEDVLSEKTGKPKFSIFLTKYQAEVRVLKRKPKKRNRKKKSGDGEQGGEGDGSGDEFEDEKSEDGQAKPSPSKRRRLQPQLNKAESGDEAGRDDADRMGFEHEDFCQLCKTPGELVLCNWCPLSYHPACIGFDSIPKGYFSCPHHSCAVCERKANEAGGLLFRCVVCPCAFCEDHQPVEAEDHDTCDRLEALGYKQPGSAFYIACSTSCIKYFKDWKRDCELESCTSSARRKVLEQEKEAADAETVPEHECGITKPRKKKEKLYCICRKPYDDEQFYIHCDTCREWYHGACVGVEEGSVEEDDEYTCPSCKRKEDLRQNNEGGGKYGLNKKDAEAEQDVEDSDYNSEDEEEDDEEGDGIERDYDGNTIVADGETYGMEEEIKLQQKLAKKAGKKGKEARMKLLELQGQTAMMEGQGLPTGPWTQGEMKTLLSTPLEDRRKELTELQLSTQAAFRQASLGVAVTDDMKATMSKKVQRMEAIFASIARSTGMPPPPPGAAMMAIMSMMPMMPKAPLPAGAAPAMGAMNPMMPMMPSTAPVVRPPVQPPKPVFAPPTRTPQMEWTPQQVSEWVGKDLGLSRIANTFLRGEIGGEELLVLTSEDFGGPEFGLTLFESQKLQSAIALYTSEMLGLMEATMRNAKLAQSQPSEAGAAKDLRPEFAQEDLEEDEEEDYDDYDDPD